MNDYIAETIEHRNHTIEIYQDDGFAPHINPLEDCDHSMCVEVYYDRSTMIYDQSDKTVVSYKKVIAPEFTEKQIRDNWKEIISSVDADCSSLLLFFTNYSGYGRNQYHNATDMFNDAIYDLIEGLSISERYDALETMYNLLPDYAAFAGSGQGYNHNYITIIELQKYVGKGNAIEVDTKDKATDYIKSMMETYDCWAAGNVYGYVIYEGIDNAELGITKSDESVGSCWGFIGEYGSDEYNYMIQTAKDATDASIKQLELEFEEVV